MTLSDGLISIGVLLLFGFIIVSKIAKDNPDGMIADFFNSLKENREMKKRMRKMPDNTIVAQGYPSQIGFM